MSLRGPAQNRISPSMLQYTKVAFFYHDCDHATALKNDGSLSQTWPFAFPRSIDWYPFLPVIRQRFRLKSAVTQGQRFPEACQFIHSKLYEKRS